MTSPQSTLQSWSSQSTANPANDGAGAEASSSLAVASKERPSTASARSPAVERAAEWVEAHEALSRLAQRRAALDAEEGPVLLRALRSGAHRHLGYGSFFEYAERLFGYLPRTTDDKLRTAEALESLPELSRALAEGRVHGSAVRELSRVATAETEREWLDAAQGHTIRQIEKLVLGHARGDRPSDVPQTGARRHILRFDVAAETLATFREAMKKLRQDSGERLDDDSALLLMARHVLGGSGSAHLGRASYQLAVVTCEHCGRGFQEAAGERVEVRPEIVDMALCDAQCIGHVAAASPCEPAPAAAESASTHVGQPTTAVPSTLPPSSANSAGQRRFLSPTRRATQTIPTALRRQVLRRDAECCKVPGCKQATFVDLHHVQPRSEGGQHDADLVMVLCSAHHRSVHTGQLFISGGVSAGLCFQHADGSAYGSVGSAQLAAACELVFRGLRNLGFRERESRLATARARAEVDDAEASPEQLLRAALATLTPSYG